MPDLLPDRLLDHTRTLGGRVALRWKDPPADGGRWHNLSWLDLYSAVERLAHALHTLPDGTVLWSPHPHTRALLALALPHTGAALALAPGGAPPPPDPPPAPLRWLSRQQTALTAASPALRWQGKLLSQADLPKTLAPIKDPCTEILASTDEIQAAWLSTWIGCTLLLGPPAMLATEQSDGWIADAEMVQASGLRSGWGRWGNRAGRLRWVAVGGEVRGV